MRSWPGRWHVHPGPPESWPAAEEDDLCLDAQCNTWCFWRGGWRQITYPTPCPKCGYPAPPAEAED